MKDERALVEAVARKISWSQWPGYMWPEGRRPDDRKKTRTTSRAIIALVREHDRRRHV